MDSKTRDTYITRIENELRSNILTFWMQHAIDREKGGFFGEVRSDLTVDRDAERGSLLSARILWTFAAAYRRYAKAEYLETARWAYRDLMERFWDEQNGGFYWSATADGKPLRTRKQVYGQAFGIYALSEFHRATGEAEPLQRAIRIFQLLEKHARDRKEGGYFEAYTKEWVLEADLRLSEIDMNEPKSQNTLLHVMEGYTNLLRVWRDPALLEAQTALVRLMIEKVLNAKTFHLGLFFSETWELRSDRISFGHDIEAAWLLTEAAQVIGDAKLIERIRGLAVEIARVTKAEGVDTDGALLYEAGPNGITLDYKEWWPQAEAAVGFLDAYSISGDKAYLSTALRLWDFIDENLVDRKNGEWLRFVNRDRSAPADQSKASFWKCPYHNGRACMELVERLKTV